MTNPMQAAFKAIMDTYNPLDIKDVLYLYIDLVAHDLAESHDLYSKSRNEIEDEVLRTDLEYRKNKLQVIDGGKA